MERDFAPVSLVVITSFVLAVHPAVPVRDVKTLIALARSHPGKLTFSSPGVGSSAHFAGELFNMMAGVIKQGFEAQAGTPEQFAAFIRGELAQNARLARFAGLNPE